LQSENAVNFNLGQEPNQNTVKKFVILWCKGEQCYCPDADNRLMFYWFSALVYCF